jgi:hypothetical protein
MQQFNLIVGASNDLVLMHDHSANWNFSRLHRPFGLFERLAHVVLVKLGEIHDDQAAILRL